MILSVVFYERKDIFNEKNFKLTKNNTFNNVFYNIILYFQKIVLIISAIANFIIKIRNVRVIEYFPWKNKPWCMKIQKIFKYWSETIVRNILLQQIVPLQLLKWFFSHDNYPKKSLLTLRYQTYEGFPQLLLKLLTSNFYKCLHTLCVKINFTHRKRCVKSYFTHSMKKSYFCSLSLNYQ